MSGLDEESTFSGGDCPQGIHCKINTSDHFIFMRHPKVECPVCNEDFHMYEINAHITFCLEKGEDRGDNDAMQDTTGSGVERKTMLDNHPTNPLQAQRQNSGSCEASKLTPQQMSSMARMVLKAQGNSNTSSDQSLVQMLSRFSSLGFTKENIRKTIEQAGSETEMKSDPNSLPEPSSRNAVAGFPPLGVSTETTLNTSVPLTFSLKQPTFQYDDAGSFGRKDRSSPYPHPYPKKKHRSNRHSYGQAARLLAFARDLRYQRSQMTTTTTCDFCTQGWSSLLFACSRQYVGIAVTKVIAAHVGRRACLS